MSVRSDIMRSIGHRGRRYTTDTDNELDSMFSLAAIDGVSFEQTRPLKRSDCALSKAAAGLFELFGRKAGGVYPVCGIRQEYFLIDGRWYNERADLMFTGRTLVGAPQPGGCPPEVPEDRYVSLKESVIAYQNAVWRNTNELYKHDDDMVPPYKVNRYDDISFHNKGNVIFVENDDWDHKFCSRNRPEINVYAHEFVQNLEKSYLAAVQNMLLMDTMKAVAAQGGLACLLHEKPFAGVSGVGKRVCWTLAGDEGGYLLNPGDTINEKLLFLTVAASMAYAVHRHGDLLCAAAASAGNEDRLGADECDPSAVISLSLCEQLAKAFAAIEAGKAKKGKTHDLDGICGDIWAGLTSYGVASPAAITGKAFEFAILGGSMGAATLLTVINTIMADSMSAVCERIKKELAKDNGGGQHGDAADKQHDMAAAVTNVLSAVIKESKPVLFEVGAGSGERAEEAQTRGLPSAASVHEAVKAFVTPKSVELFKRHAVLSEAELTAMHDARLNQYCKTLGVEVKALTDIVNTRVLPSAYNYQTDIASGLEVLRLLADDMTIEMTDGALEDRKEMFEKLTADIYHLRKNLKELSAMADKARGMGMGEKAAYLFKEVKPQMNRVRQYVDALEGYMSDEAWPLPKYREMLFIV